LIHETGLEEKVILTGFQPYQTLPRYINMASVCINPYIVNEETIDLFPEKILRYVACGKPTVATSLNGIKAILPGKTHGVVYTKDTAGMVKEITALLKSPANREQLGNAGLNKIRKTFSQDRVTGELEKILTEMIKKKAAEKEKAAEKK
jgi:glycosyltransferase involved in cell wall biosynthesis